MAAVATHSHYLASLTEGARGTLEARLLDRQSGRCFICDDAIDPVLHQGLVELDHIVPLAEHGPDREDNLALTHASCNRRKGPYDLRVARRMAEFERVQQDALDRGERGANLGHVLERHGGATAAIRLRKTDARVDFTLSEVADETIHSVPLYRDSLSKMEYFFAVLPLEYIHHDDRINPRAIGSNIRSLIVEFLRQRPQLHVGLAWWAPEHNGTGKIKMFDGQHKAAAQILIGSRRLPVRVFVEPDLKVLLQANTNAGDKLRQVAFDTAVLRHLGRTLYAERVTQYQKLKGLASDDYSFSEKDLVVFFHGEHREVQKYIVDWVRDSVSYHADNRLKEYVEWAGKKGDRPLAYAAVERTFFAEFLCKYALDTPIALGMDRGDNPRTIERDQLVRLMSLYADIFCVDQWDPDLGGRRLEARLQKGEKIAEGHLRAWRVTREEILAIVMRYIRAVIEHCFAVTGELVEKDRLMQHRLPENVWARIETFLRNLAGQAAWVDKNLSGTVFGAKQNREFWAEAFKTGRGSSGVQIFAGRIDVIDMMRE